MDEASRKLGRHFEQRPVYFFLGDFSHGRDPSRPAALIVPLSNLPTEAISFTLGDSMTVAEQRERRLYRLDEIVELFTSRKAIARFGLSDRFGFQTDFIEIQVWGSLIALARNSARFFIQQWNLGFRRHWTRGDSSGFITATSFGSNITISRTSPVSWRYMTDLVFEAVKDADGGYSAECLTENIFTQADNWDDLRRNVIDATAAFFFDQARPQRIRLHLVRDEVLSLA